MSETRRPSIGSAAAAILLALAAIATAWSERTSRRGGTAEQASASGRTRAIRIEAARPGLGRPQTQVDVATFTQWVDAYAQRRTRRSRTFYFGSASAPSSSLQS